MSRTSTAMGRLTELAHARSRYTNRLYRRNYDQMKNEEMSQRLAMVAQNKQMEKDKFPDTFTMAGLGMQTLGSAFPGWGHLVGAIGGGAIGLFGNAIHNQSVDPSLDFSEAMGESVTRPFENGSFINNMAKIPSQLRGIVGGGGVYGGGLAGGSLFGGGGGGGSLETLGGLAGSALNRGSPEMTSPVMSTKPRMGADSVAAATTGLSGGGGSVGQGLTEFNDYGEIKDPFDQGNWGR